MMRVASLGFLDIIIIVVMQGKRLEQAQLILVANAANGVSVKFSNWEDFFPFEYV